MLFEVLLLGEHVLHGFTNRDLRQKLARTSYPLASEVVKRPGQVTRLLRRIHAPGLVAKIPHSRRWRVSLAARRIPRAPSASPRICLPEPSPEPTADISPAVARFSYAKKPACFVLLSTPPTSCYGAQLARWTRPARKTHSLQKG